MPSLVKTSFQLDKQLLADVRVEAERRGELPSVVIREWLRLGRDESRRREAQFSETSPSPKQCNQSAA